MTPGQTKAAAAKRPAGTVIERPAFLKAKPGDSFEGRVTGTTTIQGKDKTTERYLFETTAGRPWILPGDADLKGKLKQSIERHGLGTRTYYLELTAETVDIGRPSRMKIWLVIDITDGAAVAKPPIDGAAKPATEASQSQVPLLPEGRIADNAGDEDVPF